MVTHEEVETGLDMDMAMGMDMGMGMGMPFGFVEVMGKEGKATKQDVEEAPGE